MFFLWADLKLFSKRSPSGAMNTASPTLARHTEQRIPLHLRDGSYIVNSALVHARIQAITQKYKITNIDDDVLEFMQLALQERLRTITEQLVEISHKRMDIKSDTFECIKVSEHEKKGEAENIRQRPKYTRTEQSDGNPSAQARKITYQDALVFLERDEAQLNPVFTYKCSLGSQVFGS